MATAIEENGGRAFVDDLVLRDNDDLPVAIGEEAVLCDIMVAMLSPSYLCKLEDPQEWVHGEITFAWNEKKKLFPVIVDDFQISKVPIEEKKVFQLVMGSRLRSTFISTSPCAAGAR